jgi:hypothetical protein
MVKQERYSLLGYSGRRVKSEREAMAVGDAVERSPALFCGAAR